MAIKCLFWKNSRMEKVEWTLHCAVSKMYYTGRHSISDRLKEVKKEFLKQLQIHPQVIK